MCFSCLNRSYWERNECLNIKICKFLVSNQANMSNFHTLEVVARGLNYPTKTRCHPAVWTDRLILGVRGEISLLRMLSDLTVTGDLWIYRLLQIHTSSGHMPQCCLNVGAASQTMCQHWPNIGLMYRFPAHQLLQPKSIDNLVGSSHLPGQVRDGGGTLSQCWATLSGVGTTFMRCLVHVFS